jgi:CRP-like cAMP-binding protein
VTDPPRRAAQQWTPRSLLAGLDPAATVELISLGQARSVETGRYILREGDKDTQVEVIMAGYCKVSMLTSQGHKALMAVRGPGDVIGELAGLGGAPRNATVEASGRVSLVTIAGPVFQRFIATHSAAAAEMTGVLGHRLAWSNRRRADAAYPVEVRLARLLTDLAEICGRPSPQGTELLVPLTQGELASMIGAALPTVQRALAALRREGRVDTGYRRLVITDRDALAGPASG